MNKDLQQPANIIDISWPITPGMTSYKDSKPVTLIHNKIFERDGVRDSSISCNMHTGTHVDAPAHFLADGRAIETVPLYKLIGPCLVIDCTMLEEKITANDLEPYDKKLNDIIVLFKTTCSLDKPTAPFRHDFTYVDHTAAQFLVDHRARAVGIDSLGIERNQPNHQTHAILLRAEIPIIEGLRLGHITAGVYQFICLPLAINGLEAAPARAVLLS